MPISRLGSITSLALHQSTYNRRPRSSAVTLEERLESVRARVRTACERSGRAVEDVTLVAVSKQRTVEEIREAYNLGVRDFGENRAKEMAAKAAELPADVRWHFLGPIQSNRIRILHETAHLVHSFDRVEIGEKWVRRTEEGSPTPVLLQVNVAEEPRKRGIPPGEVNDALDALREAGVPVAGLATMPPWAEDPAESAPHFRHLAKLRDELGADHSDLRALSMGTTQDFEVAIEYGATHVRVGTAIFGPRQYD